MKKVTACALFLVVLCSSFVPRHVQGGQRPALREVVDRPYLEILELAPGVSYPQAEIDACRKYLVASQKEEEDANRLKIDATKRRLKDVNDRLERMNRATSSDSPEQARLRTDLHCDILKGEAELARLRVIEKHGIPNRFDNRKAKLELLVTWPAKSRDIARTIAEGNARRRRFGNPEDIGVRHLQDGQEKDVRLGEETIRDMKAYGLMPPEVQDPAVVEYVNRLAQTIAEHSDLTVPLKVTILDSDEINAFALPGGYLFIDRGLILETRNEAQLAGVIGHEIAHVAARHGARLMKRATIAGIVFQAAQVAAIILTGGVVGIGTYYALNYGFFGLGLLLDLTLLGVNRDFEAEADVLGAQYLWHAGYDPRGFIQFFDVLASEKGYIKGSSFFRTHPPFIERMYATFSEISYLPEKEGLIVDSDDFRAVRDHLKTVVEEQRKRPRKAGPSLKKKIECDRPIDLGN